jgi:H+-translocating NAD(P) transhydrogenase subunit alpha
MVNGEWWIFTINHSPFTIKVFTIHNQIIMNSEIFIALIYILVMASYAGFELIAKVPPTLHTPLMSGSNAISGITIVGAILCCNELGYTTLSKIFGMIAVALAMINVVGGYAVTDRMLKMFKKK